MTRFIISLMLSLAVALPATYGQTHNTAPAAPAADTPDKQPDLAPPQPAPAPDPKLVAEQAAQYRALLAQPAHKLVALGQERGAKILAELQYGRDRAKWEAREKNLERLRVEMLGRADEARERIDEIRARVDLEMNDVRSQFSDDPGQRDRQLMAVVQLFQRDAEEAKAMAEKYEAQARNTDQQLASIRQHLLTLGRDQRLAEKGIQFRTSRPPVIAADLDLDPALLSELGLDPAMLNELGIASDVEDDVTVPTGAPAAPSPVSPAVETTPDAVSRAIEELRKVLALSNEKAS